MGVWLQAGCTGLAGCASPLSLRRFSRTTATTRHCKWCPSPAVLGSTSRGLVDASISYHWQQLCSLSSALRAQVLVLGTIQVMYMDTIKPGYMGTMKPGVPSALTGGALCIHLTVLVDHFGGLHATPVAPHSCSENTYLSPSDPEDFIRVRGNCECSSGQCDAGANAAAVCPEHTTPDGCILPNSPAALPDKWSSYTELARSHTVLATQWRGLTTRPMHCTPHVK
jgi:hypothetical protein